MYLHLLHGFPKDLVRDVNSIKKLGLKCVDWQKRDVVETATGRLVTQLDELTFKGNVFQVARAKKLIATFTHDE